MFKHIVAAIAKADAGDPAVGAWSDISFSSNLGGSRTTTSTITFTSGSSRTIAVTHDLVNGVLQVKVGSGSYVDVPSGYTVGITTGQSVTFKYTCYFDSESGTVTVTDSTLAATIDTFTCAFTFTG